MQENKVDYYVVRVYRQESAQGDKAQTHGLTGLVETAAGKQHAFHNMEELWRILRHDSKGNNNA